MEKNITVPASFPDVSLTAKGVGAVCLVLLARPLHLLLNRSA